MNQKVMHIADVHLRRSQFGSRSRGNDFYKALLWCVQEAHRRNIKTIVCAGDLFDASYPASDVVMQAKAIHDVLVSYDMQMLTISGNHDNTEPHWSATFTTPDARRGIVMLDDTETFLNGDGAIRIRGYKYADPMTLRKTFAEQTGPLPSIIIHHGDIAELSGYAATASTTREEFASVLRPGGIVMTGHVHVTHIKTAGGITIASPGSTELCAEDQGASKYALIHEIDDTGVYVDTEMVKIDTRPVQHMEIRDAAEAETAAAAINPDAIVFVKIHREQRAVIPRLRATMREGILRVRFFPVEHIRLESSASCIPEDRPLTLQDCLPAFIDKSHRAYGLAHALLDPAADPAAALEEYKKSTHIN